MNSVVHFEMPYDNPERVANASRRIRMGDTGPGREDGKLCPRDHDGNRSGSPPHTSGRPAEGERDDSYGANGKSGEVKKPRAAGKSSRSAKATGSPARRKR